MRTRFADRTTVPSTTASTFKFAGNLGNQFPRAFQLQHGHARDDPHRTRPCKLRDEGFGHSVGKILLLGVTRQVLERQHGNRTDAGPSAAKARTQASYVGGDEKNATDDRRNEHTGDGETEGVAQGALASRAGAADGSIG
jgi:hypothetical protein